MKVYVFATPKGQATMRVFVKGNGTLTIGNETTVLNEREVNVILSAVPRVRTM